MTIRILHLLGGGVLCGAGQYAIQLAAGLSGDEFCSALATFKRGPLERNARERGVRTFQLSRRFPGDPLVILRLARLIRQERFHILHTHTGNSHLYGRPAAWLERRCKLVSTEHAFYTEVYRQSAFLRLGYRLDLLMARWVDRHIAVSHAMKERLVDAGLEGGNIVVIPNGIDLDFYRPGRVEPGEVRKELGLEGDELLIGTSGRLTRVKNHELFIRIARLLTDSGRQAHFLLAGDGPRMGALKQYASCMGVADRVHFLGWRTDLLRIVSAMDIFALTSYSEVAPFSVLEAMAMERPVVATAVGGVPEIVEHGRTGYLVPSDQEEPFAAALLRLAKDPEARLQMGSLGRRRVALRFTQEGMLRQTGEVYRHLAGV